MRSGSVYDDKLRSGVSENTQESSASAATNDAGISATDDSSGGWYLRHRDQVEHGPFSIDDLIDAAKAGRIAPDTTVKHLITTGDQWVLARSIPGIGQYCPAATATPFNQATPVTKASPALRTTAVQPAVTVKRRRANRGNGFFSVFIQSALPVIAIAATIFVIARNPELKKRLQIALFGEPVQVTETVVETVQQEPGTATTDSANSTSASSNAVGNTAERAEHDNRPANSSTPPTGSDNDRSSNRSSIFSQNPTDSSGKRLMTTSASPSGSLADLAKPAKQSKLKISLNSTKWIAPIEDDNGTDPLIIRTVENSPVPVTVSPSSGRMSIARPTRVTFEDMIGLSLLLRVKEGETGQPRTLTGEWVYRVGDDPDATFTMGRMKSRNRYLITLLSDANRALGKRTTARAGHHQFIEFPRGKPLDMVEASESAIKKLDAEIPSFQMRVAACQQNIETFAKFMENVEKLNEEAELVVEFLDESDP